MNTTTVRLYFRNIMCFVHHDAGTDVWFFSNHLPRVFTRTRVKPLQGRVVTLQSQGEAITGNGSQRNEFKHVISMNILAPEAVASGAVVNRQLTDKLVSRLELPHAGTLSDQPSIHSFGVLLDWKTPVVGKGRPPHVQRLTEVAMYELQNVPKPIALLLAPEVGAPTTLALEPDRHGIAEAFFLAGEMPKRQLVVSPGDSQKIPEFEAIHDCFVSAHLKPRKFRLPSTSLLV